MKLQPKHTFFSWQDSKLSNPVYFSSTIDLCCMEHYERKKINIPEEIIFALTDDDAKVQIVYNIKQMM